MRKTDNEILKKTLLHYINLEYYANGLDEEFQTLLNELQARCISAIESQKSINTKAEYSILYKLIKEEVDNFKKELEERLEEQAEVIMNQELEFLDDVYNKESESGEKGKSSTVTNGTLALGGVSLAKVLFSPIDGRDTAKQFAERTGKNILRAYDTPLRTGYLFGQKSEEVTAQVSNQMKQIARGMQSGIRTAIPSFAKTTDRIVFLTNNVEVVWVATLDGRTCIKCASLSGLHFKSVSEAPSVPQHCLCRCQLLPVNSITEPIPTYNEFIESLAEDEQKQVLGVNRFEMWKKYNISLEKFINNGNVVSVKELNENLNILKNEAEKTSRPKGYTAQLRDIFSENTKPCLGQKITNNSSGIQAVFSKESQKEIRSRLQNSKVNGFTVGEHFEVANHIIDYYKEATLIVTHDDFKHGNAEIKIERFLTNPIKLSTGKETKACITVKNSLDKNMRNLYSIELMDKKKALEQTRAKGQPPKRG